jgi:hypothetical protein
MLAIEGACAGFAISCHQHLAQRIGRDGGGIGGHEHRKLPRGGAGEEIGGRQDLDTGFNAKPCPTLRDGLRHICIRCEPAIGAMQRDTKAIRIARFTEQRACLIQIIARRRHIGGAVRHRRGGKLFRRHALAHQQAVHNGLAIDGKG